MTDKQSGSFIADQLFRVACSCSAPIFWYRPAQSQKILNNATVFFVNTGRQILGISASHVFDGYRRRLDEGPLKCQIGDIEFDPCDRKIDEKSGDLDIVTFSITAEELKQMGKYAHVPPQRPWPAPTPKKGEDVFFGGYRGADRQVDTKLVTWGFSRALDNVTTSHEDYMHIQFNRETWLPIKSPRQPEMHEGWGGVSGGPVFAVLHGVVLSWQLVGVVTQFNPEWELIRASSLSKIRPDGSLETASII